MPGTHEFTIFVNNNEFRTDQKELTGSQIKGLAGIPADYDLFIVHGSNTDPVGNQQAVQIHEKVHFRAIPAGTFGGH